MRGIVCHHSVPGAEAGPSTKLVILLPATAAASMSVSSSVVFPTTARVKHGWVRPLAPAQGCAVEHAARHRPEQRLGQRSALLLPPPPPQLPRRRARLLLAVACSVLSASKHQHVPRPTKAALPLPPLTLAAAVIIATAAATAAAITTASIFDWRWWWWFEWGGGVVDGARRRPPCSAQPSPHTAAAHTLCALVAALSPNERLYKVAGFGAVRCVQKHL
mmetsp:Transcript_23184/g.46087  ORF Transcript_23184/g.46087 Transcript_23184/m.46087 type:complete len:219 (-) Transcript_23184:1611-2267(-)